MSASSQGTAEGSWLASAQKAVDRVLACFRRHYALVLNVCPTPQQQRAQCTFFTRPIEQETCLGAPPEPSPQQTRAEADETAEEWNALVAQMQAASTDPRVRTPVLLLPLRTVPEPAARPREGSGGQGAPPRGVLFAHIVGHEVMRQHIDPYVGYVIFSRHGSREATVTRRYSEFKRLNKALGKHVPPGAVFPPANSALGRRNFTPRFVHQRCEQLRQYLKELCSCDATANTDALRSFLGLRPLPQEQHEAVFVRALERTADELGLWKPFLEDTPEARLRELLQRELGRTVWQSVIQSSLGAQARRSPMKHMAKALEKLVGAASAAEWNAASAQWAAREAQTREAATAHAQERAQALQDTQKQLEALLGPLVGPLTAQASGLAMRLVRLAVSGIAKPLRAIVGEVSRAAVQVEQALAQSDTVMLQQATTAAQTALEEHQQRLEMCLHEVTVAAVAELSKTEQMEEAKDMLALVRRLPALLSALVEFAEPRPWSEVLYKILWYQDDVANCAAEARQMTLDSVEADLRFRLLWYGWDVAKRGRSLYHSLCAHELLYTQQGPLFWDTWCRLEQLLYHAFLRSFVARATDWCWAAWHAPPTPSPSPPEEPKEEATTGSKSEEEEEEEDEFGEAAERRRAEEAARAVKQAFCRGFRNACDEARCGTGALLRRLVVDLVDAPLRRHVLAAVLPRVEGALADLQARVPACVAGLVDVRALAADAVARHVRRVLEKEADGLRADFYRALNAEPLAEYQALVAQDKDEHEEAAEQEKAMDQEKEQTEPEPDETDKTQEQAATTAATSTTAITEGEHDNARANRVTVLVAKEHPAVVTDEEMV